jgi:HD superfamily phosphohydrolase
MKIYIVVQGEYSDYHIVATFVNEDVANDFANKMNSTIKGYSRDFSVETYDILSSVDEYNPNKEFLEINYRSNTKEISCENKSNDYDIEEVVYRAIYFYDKLNYHKEDFYIATMNVELTVNNVLNAEKIMMDWVTQIEHELQNTFNGDLKAYKEYFDKNRPPF